MNGWGAEEFADPVGGKKSLFESFVSWLDVNQKFILNSGFLKGFRCVF